MEKKYKAIVMRFVKAYISGAATVLSVATVNNIHSWTDLSTALNIILLASVVGGVNGIFMATEKYARWKN